jgi:HSP20 family protein
MTTNKEISVTKGTSEPATRIEGHEDEYVLPLADIYETPDAYVVMLDMPGAQKENIRVRLERGSLMVTAPSTRHFQESGTVLHEETRTRGYARAFALGEGIDVKNVDAQYQDGVLTIKLFKNEELKPREISIR